MKAYYKTDNYELRLFGKVDDIVVYKLYRDDISIGCIRVSKNNHCNITLYDRELDYNDITHINALIKLLTKGRENN